MADNVAITAGSGTDIATDDVSSVHYQKVKLDAGGNGLSVPVIAGQQTMAASVPVVVASDQTAVAISAASLPLPSGASTSALQTSGNTLLGGGLPAALAAGGGLKVEGVAGGVAVPVTISAGTKIVSGSITRPANTTAYAAGDAITDSTSAPTAITFAGCASANGGTGTIYSCQLVDGANQSTKGQFELWVFAGTATPTPDNDNAVFTPTDAELANLVGIFEFNAWYVGDATSGVGGNCVSRALNQNMGFDCGASVDDLYGLMVVRNAYTPVSGEVFTFILHVGQD
jgi:hypothetical protein